MTKYLWGFVSLCFSFLELFVGFSFLLIKSEGMCMCKTAFPTKEIQGGFDLRPLLYHRHLWYLSQSISS